MGPRRREFGVQRSDRKNHHSQVTTAAVWCLVLVLAFLLHQVRFATTNPTLLLRGEPSESDFDLVLSVGTAKQQPKRVTPSSDSNDKNNSRSQPLLSIDAQLAAKGIPRYPAVYATVIATNAYDWGNNPLHFPTRTITTK